MRGGIKTVVTAQYAKPSTAAEATDAQVNAAAKKFVVPDRFVWVVIGDRAKVEAGIKALNLGDVVLLDADGRPKAAVP